MSRQLLVLIPLVLIIPRFFGAEGLACCQALSDLISGVCLALPFAVAMLRKINKLNDGDPAPFGRAGRRA